MIATETFTLELRATQLREIALELAAPQLPLTDLDHDIRSRLPSEVTDNWRGIQALVADAIRQGRALSTEPDVSRYIAAVIRQRSYLWHTLRHEPADEARFRGDLTDNVGGVVGIPLAASLIRRPMSNLVSDAHPYYGWATNHEIRAMLDSLAADAVPSRDQQTVDLDAFLRCLRAAVDRGYDLATIYDAPTTEPAAVHPEVRKPG